MGLLPMLGVRLARLTSNPDLVISDGESLFLASPPPLFAKGDVVEGWIPFRRVFDVVAYGKRHVMMGATQVDRHGNQNISAIGDFAQPKRQLLGSRGAPADRRDVSQRIEIAAGDRSRQAGSSCGMEHDQREDGPETVKPGDDLHANFRLRVPKDTTYTRPYWHRDDPETESINHIDNEKYATLPFPPPALRARVEYSATGGDAGTRNGITTVVVTPFLDDAGKQSSRPLAIVPSFSVMLEPGTQVISTHNGSTSTVAVGVTSNLTRDVQGVLRLELPAGWRSEPAQFAVELKARGEKQDFQFKVFPTGLQEGRATIRRGAGIGRREIQRGIHAGHARRSGQLLLLPAGAAAREHRRRAGSA